MDIQLLITISEEDYESIKRIVLTGEDVSGILEHMANLYEEKTK